METRDADTQLLNASLERVKHSGTPFQLITVGPVENLWERWERRTIGEADAIGQIAGLCEAGIFLSVKPGAPADNLAARALAAGCRTLVPASGCYPELIPEAYHSDCLYEFSATDLADRLQQTLRSNTDAVSFEEAKQILKPFDALTVCRGFDERLEELVNASRLSG